MKKTKRTHRIKDIDSDNYTTYIVESVSAKDFYGKKSTSKVTEPLNEATLELYERYKDSLKQNLDLTLNSRLPYTIKTISKFTHYKNMMFNTVIKQIKILGWL